MNRASLFALLGLVAAVLAAPTSQTRPDSRKLHLRSTYWSSGIPIGERRVRQVMLQATLAGGEGEGHLSLDPNTCMLDEFGEPGACTMMAPMMRRVTLRKLDVEDPAKRGRELYTLAGHDGAPETRLVVPTQPGDPFRLIIAGEEGKNVIALEPVSR